MAAGINLASKYAKQVDERFTRESQAMLALNNDYEFTGVETVKVYSIPVAPLGNYTKSGLTRYGTAGDLTRNVQTMTITQDKAFTFVIDKGDKVMSQMVMDAGKALSREQKEVLVPYFDTYVFKKLADTATSYGNTDSTALANSNAYAMFLNGMEALGNANVPDQGRVAFCSYRYANLLKQDPAFMKYGDKSQEMLIKGVIGEVDGCKIVKVPASRLPMGCGFILTHPIAACAPKILEDYKIHDNPPGLSGWLVEGRFLFDCFVLNEKISAIYYHGGQSVLGALDVRSSATDTNKSTIYVNGTLASGHHWAWYKGTAPASVSYGDTVVGGTTAGWTALSTNPEEITLTGDSNTIFTVVETDASNYVIAVGTALINKG